MASEQLPPQPAPVTPPPPAPEPAPAPAAPALQPLQPGSFPHVPWGPRETGIGLVLLLLWLAFSMGGALLLRILRVRVDTGLLVTFLEALLLLPVWWLTLRRHKADLGALGLRRFPPVMLLLALGLMLVAYTFNLFYVLVLKLLNLSPSLDLVTLVSQLEHPWLFLLGGVVVAPVAEEIFFRGLVFAGLRGRYGWVPAALLSAAAFSLVHLQPLMALPIFVMGFFMALLYEKSGSIWPAIAMHAAINAIGLGAAYFLSQMGVVP